MSGQLWKTLYRLLISKFKRCKVIFPFMSQCRCNTNKNKVDVFFLSDEHDSTHEHLKVKHVGELSKCRLLET